MVAPPIEIENLSVTYQRGLFRQPVHALKNLNMSLQPGEVFGFLGPNGAGKTTTIKTLLGFLHPSGGRVSVLGEPAGSVQARRKLGYLPEMTYYYRFLTAREILWMFGRFLAIPKSTLRTRVDELLELVGLSRHADKYLKEYSKGMMQRVGLGQALVGDPDLLILDEPTSGLDPLGRRDMRRILHTLREQGKSIFFSSHELGEVELISDRVAILVNGSEVQSGKLSEILQPLSSHTVSYRVPETVPDALKGYVDRSKPDPKQHGVFLLSVSESAELPRIIAEMTENGAELIDIRADQSSLEDFFCERITEPS